MTKEIRNICAEVRADKESRKVEGYALLFGVDSDGLSFTERIEAGALDGVIEKSDVFALLNHDNTRGILARCTGGDGPSMKLTVDEKGLRYEFEAPKTQLGDELLENLRRGEVTTSSFCFDMNGGEEKWEKLGDDQWVRTINRFGNLYDVSPVYSAAYSKTSVCLRGKEQAEAELQAIEEAKRKAEEEAQKAEAEARAKEQADYIAQLRSEIPNE